MDEFLKNKATKESLYEMKRAMGATLVTFMVAVGIYFILPRISDYRKTSGPLHTRSFEKIPNGGKIVYRYSGDSLTGLKPGSRPDSSENLRSDIEILERRFRRGQFEISALPGFRQTALYTKLTENSSKFRYSAAQGDGNSLAMEASDPESIRVIHEYMDYLKEKWIQ